MKDTLKQHLPGLVSFYEDLHANPEISFFEKETSKKLSAVLTTAGFTSSTPVGKYDDNTLTCYGVVAVLSNGDGPTILVRADMDALPLQEKTNAAHASSVHHLDELGRSIPVMHACGHDLHVVTLAGTAQVMAATKKNWRGTLVFVGQPAEERAGGARALLADGLYDNWPVPDYALSQHCDPNLAVGQVGLCPGWAMANVDMLDIIIHGIGAHGAMPHEGRDPIVLAAELISAFQTIVSRSINPVDTGVVTVGSIHGGTKSNIIPDEVKLQLTIRSFTDAVRSRILSEIKRMTHHLALAHGLPDTLLPEIIHLEEEYFPALYNDPELTTTAKAVFGQVFGEDNVKHKQPTTGGEDFSEYGRTGHKVPLLMFRVGTSPTDVDLEKQPGCHSPFFLPMAGPSIETGVTAMTSLLHHLMGGK
ncbi:MAG: amidohydrolase [Desulfobacteraceae bacterium]|nr:amidohydrolase [Desulfobacteraceae bacterium]